MTNTDRLLAQCIQLARDLMTQGYDYDDAARRAVVQTPDLYGDPQEQADACEHIAEQLRNAPRQPAMLSAGVRASILARIQASLFAVTNDDGDCIGWDDDKEIDCSDFVGDLVHLFRFHGLAPNREEEPAKTYRVWVVRDVAGNFIDAIGDCTDDVNGDDITADQACTIASERHDVSPDGLTAESERLYYVPGEAEWLKRSKA